MILSFWYSGHCSLHATLTHKEARQISWCLVVSELSHCSWRNARMQQQQLCPMWKHAWENKGVCVCGKSEETKHFNHCRLIHHCFTTGILYCFVLTLLTASINYNLDFPTTKPQTEHVFFLFSWRHFDWANLSKLVELFCFSSDSCTSMSILNRRGIIHNLDWWPNEEG